MTCKSVLLLEGSVPEYAAAGRPRRFLSCALERTTGWKGTCVQVRTASRAIARPGAWPYTTAGVGSGLRQFYPWHCQVNASRAETAPIYGQLTNL